MSTQTSATPANIWHALVLHLGPTRARAAVVALLAMIVAAIVIPLVATSGHSSTDQDTLTPGQKIISWLTQDVGGWCGYSTNAYATSYTNSWHAGADSVYEFSVDDYLIDVSIPAGTDPAQAQRWFTSVDNGLSMPRDTPVSVNCNAG